MSKMISKLTLGLIAGAFVLSPLAYAGDEPAKVEEVKQELEAKKQEISQDKAELKKDRAERRQLRRKLHAERKAARKARKELIKSEGAPQTEGEPVTQ